MTPVKRKQSQSFPPRFKIMEKLGEGGVAAVYKVLDRKSDSIRALKALKPELIRDPLATDRFQDEFRILRHLHHPGLPEMYDYGVTEDGTPYIIMEYIEGEPLDDYCAENPDDLRLLLYEITEALSFIHTHNLLHLDIKPDNILVRRTTAYSRSEKPEAVLIDFGMSYRRDEAGEVTVSGTPAYMPPEIIRREDDLTRAADYYNLGATIYELIEGRVPFEGSLEEVLRAHLSSSVAFERETVEHTDLYPRVRELMSKDINPRLEGFESFRRELAARESGEVPPLERAYGMGYIESLGMIGKKDIWDNLKNWVEITTLQLEERKEERIQIDKLPDLEIEKKTKDERSLTTSLDLLKDFKEKARAVEGVARQKEKHKGSIKETPRTIVITGTEGSGKSYLADACRGECLLKGMDVWVVGDGGDYEQLVSEDIYTGTDAPAKVTQTVDPKALIIDRFVRGWERLQDSGRRNGAVLIIDGHQEATDEEREFLEYVSKRLQIVLNEGNEPGVFLVVTGRSPSLPRKIKSILPKGEKLKHHVVPSPSGKDIDIILNSFHGQMAGTNDRKQLGEYLKQNQDSSGSVIESMKHAAVQRNFVREKGHWRFTWVSKARKKDIKKEKRNYYRVLLQEVGDKERELLSWLSCHRDPVAKIELMEVMGVSDRSIEKSLERLKPYRLIDVTKEGGREYLGIISTSVADGLYENVAKAEARQVNNKLISYYMQLLDLLEESRGRKRASKKIKTADLAQYAKICESLSLHFGRTGEKHQSLLMRVKAIKALRKLQDLFGLRRLCNGGIQTSRALRGKYWQSRKWHIERYFIKEWIEAEWMAENHYSITALVRDNIIKRNRNIMLLSLSSFYIYGMALRWQGDYQACSRLLKMQRRSRYVHSPPYISTSLLIDAALLNNQNKYLESISVLDRLDSYDRYLNNYQLCNIYLFYALNFYYLGNKKSHSKYLIKLKNLAITNAFYDELLFVYYYEIDELFNQANYSASKSILRKALLVASRKKYYYRLANMYHLLSGIYFEEGVYEKAISSMSRASVIAENLGLIQWKLGSKLRIAFNLDKMGLWGSAIAYGDEVRSAAVKNSWSEMIYYSNIHLFALFTKIKSNKAHKFRIICNNYGNKVKNKYACALYEYTLGNYYAAYNQPYQAIAAYKKAQKAYMNIEYKDDSVRSEIKLINAYLDLGVHKKAKKHIENTNDNIKNMESNDIMADYMSAVLKYNYITRQNKKKIMKSARLCEEALKKTNDINIVLRISAILFRVYSRFGEMNKGSNIFKLFHNKLKLIVNQLEDYESISNLIKYGDYAHLLKEAKTLKKKRKTKPSIVEKN
jgi:serine/threonine protein kinase